MIKLPKIEWVEATRVPDVEYDNQQLLVLMPDNTVYKLHGYYIEPDPVYYTDGSNEWYVGEFQFEKGAKDRQIVAYAHIDFS